MSIIDFRSLVGLFVLKPLETAASLLLDYVSISAVCWSAILLTNCDEILN